MNVLRSLVFAFSVQALFTLQTFSQSKIIPFLPQEQSLADVVEKASGAVAFISTEEGTGSGFYINADGYVVTALHVVKLRDGSTAKRISIETKNAVLVFGNGNVLQGNSVGVIATVLNEDAEHDIALLKPQSNPFNVHVAMVNGKDLSPSRHPATLCPRAFKLRSGEQIFTIGHPFGDFRRITTAGIIASSEPIEVDSARQLRGTYLVNMLINHGNSGGPVFTQNGCVIGVADAIRLAPIEAMTVQAGVQLNSSPITGVDNRLAQVVPAYNSGLGILVPHQYVLDLLHGAGIESYKASK